MKVSKIDRRRLAIGLMDAASIALTMKSRRQIDVRSRRLAIEVFDKQAAEFEKSFVAKVSPLFKEQIDSALSKLEKFRGTRPALSDLFNPRDWDKELIDRALPPYAIAMSESAIAQFKLIAADLKNIGKSFQGEKASTASQWLARILDLNEIDLEWTLWDTPYGNVQMHIATEYPGWMRALIRDGLAETFSQDYWKEINDTTGGDINILLDETAIDGWSIEKLSREMQARYGSAEYPLNRGRRVGRTEIGNALNSARSKTIDALKEDLGVQYPMRKIWLSVLGNTTRDAHANLDSVPADQNGMWILGGIPCRWPGDPRLPAKNRVHCQCTVYAQFGMQDQEADELIQEATQRQQTEQ